MAHCGCLCCLLSILRLHMMHLLILLVKQHAALALEGLHDKGIEIMLGQRVNYEGLLEGFNGQNQLILTFSLRSLIFEP